jgi:hypothetical protein
MADGAFAVIGVCRILFVMRVNSTDVLDEGLRIEETGRQMNLKVESVKQDGYRK